MSDPRDPHAQYETIGSPVTAIRPGFDMEEAAVRLMLTAPSAPALLDTLGITGQDAEELLALIPAVVEDPQMLTAVTQGANLLRRHVGLEASPADLSAHTEAWNALQQPLAPGIGLIAILAHVVSTDVVRTFHRERGIDEATSWATLADLGQQMRVHRTCSGRLGLLKHRWTALNWTGRLIALGRLQFDLHRRRLPGRDEEQWLLGAHIPATGPLEPAACDESFRRARALASEQFPDLGIDGVIVCDSWMISEGFREVLGPESNLSRFAARWEILSREDATADAIYFVFNRENTKDRADLPRRTRLERALAERISSGEGWQGGLGLLRDPGAESDEGTDETGAA